ncbi:hypothetical protein BD779DRAFT_1684715 [Infundibulicybe gibba]|nr:hypothetical protein BD779DRAFT_1684715 [Infundibulicybe gibba]
MATQTNVSRLNAVVIGLEDLQSQVRDLQEARAKSDKKIGVLHALNQQSEVKIEELTDRVAFLEDLLNVEEDGLVITEPSRATGGESEAGGSSPGWSSVELDYIDGIQDKSDTQAGIASGGVEEDGEMLKMASAEAKKSKPIKDAVNKTFMLLLGVDCKDTLKHQQWRAVSQEYSREYGGMKMNT